MASWPKRLATLMQRQPGWTARYGAAGGILVGGGRLSQRGSCSAAARGSFARCRPCCAAATVLHVVLDVLWGSAASGRVGKCPILQGVGGRVGPQPSTPRETHAAAACVAVWHGSCAVPSLWQPSVVAPIFYLAWAAAAWWAWGARHSVLVVRGGCLSGHLYFSHALTLMSVSVGVLSSDWCGGVRACMGFRAAPLQQLYLSRRCLWGGVVGRSVCMGGLARTLVGSPLFD